MELKEATVLVRELLKPSIFTQQIRDALWVLIDTVEHMPQTDPKPSLNGEIKLTPDQLIEIKLLIKHSNSIVPAIKQVRMYTGCSLKDAKEYVDSLKK